MREYTSLDVLVGNIIRIVCEGQSELNDHITMQKITDIVDEAILSYYSDEGVREENFQHYEDRMYDELLMWAKDTIDSYLEQEVYVREESMRLLEEFGCL